MYKATGWLSPDFAIFNSNNFYILMSDSISEKSNQR